MSVGRTGAENPLRPLHVVESWLPALTGYTTRSSELVAAQERSLDLEPRVLVTSRQELHARGQVSRKFAGVDLGDRIRVGGSSDRERRLRRVRRWTVDRSVLRDSVLAMIDEWGADLVHVHWSSTIGSAAAEAARRRGLPLIAEVRFDLAGAMSAQSLKVPGEPARRLVESGLRRVFERHLRQADAVVAASHSLGALLASSYPELEGRIAVAANGCDPDRFTPGPGDSRLRESLGLGGCRIVGTTATMLRYEGLDLLVRAIAGLGSGERDVALLLVGHGPEAERLAALARRSGVRCVQTGPVRPDRVVSYYRLMDVFAIPRRDVAVTRYAAPIKLMEALACGRACVSSAVGDVPDLLSAGRGVLVPPDDMAALTRALSTLLADEEARAGYGQAARAYAVQAPGWEAACEVHRQVYRGVLDRRLACP